MTSFRRVIFVRSCRVVGNQLPSHLDFLLVFKSLDATHAANTAVTVKAKPYTRNTLKSNQHAIKPKIINTILETKIRVNTVPTL